MNDPISVGDYTEVLDEDCPICGDPLFRTDCDNSMCIMGFVDLHDEDPINHSPGDYDDCPTCLGVGTVTWCPSCSYESL